MDKQKKRTYNSTSRKDKAADTKKRLLASAKRLFEIRGFDVVTIDEIARAADVSAPTIYSLFRSKKGVLKALIDEALPPDQFGELVRKAKAEKTPSKHLNITAKVARELYEAEKSQISLLRGISVLDPQYKQLEQELEKRRYRRLLVTVKTMEGEGILKKGVDLAKAHDILWAFTGRDLYRLLVLERGWTPQQYEKWLAQTLKEALLKNPKGDLAK